MTVTQAAHGRAPRVQGTYRPSGSEGSHLPHREERKARRRERERDGGDGENEGDGEKQREKVQGKEGGREEREKGRKDE